MSTSRTNPPVWRQARTLTILFWTGFGFAPLAALLLLIGDTGFPIKLALILGLGSVVLIGLSVVLRPDAETVERDLYAALADSEAETKRALAELRGDVRRQLGGHEPAKAVASAPPPRELPSYENRQPMDEPRRPRPIQQGPPEYAPRATAHRGGAEERDPAYLPETTAVPRQRWEDERAGHPGEAAGERRGGRRGQAAEGWRAEEPATGETASRGRRARGVESGWSDEVYKSDNTPSRGSRAVGDSGAAHASRDAEGSGRRGRRYREPDELDGVIPARRYREDDDTSGEIPTRSGGESHRRREYADGESRSRKKSGGSYMDTYYGDNRR